MITLNSKFSEYLIKSIFLFITIIFLFTVSNAQDSCSTPPINLKINGKEDTGWCKGHVGLGVDNWYGGTVDCPYPQDIPTILDFSEKVEFTWENGQDWEDCYSGRGKSGISIWGPHPPVYAVAPAQYSPRVVGVGPSYGNAEIPYSVIDENGEPDESFQKYNWALEELFYRGVWTCNAYYSWSAAKVTDNTGPWGNIWNGAIYSPWNRFKLDCIAPIIQELSVNTLGQEPVQPGDTVYITIKAKGPHSTDNSYPTIKYLYLVHEIYDENDNLVSTKDIIWGRYCAVNLCERTMQYKIPVISGVENPKHIFKAKATNWCNQVNPDYCGYKSPEVPLNPEPSDPNEPTQPGEPGTPVDPRYQLTFNLYQFNDVLDPEQRPSCSDDVSNYQTVTNDVSIIAKSENTDYIQRINLSGNNKITFNIQPQDYPVNVNFINNSTQCIILNSYCLNGNSNPNLRFETGSTNNIVLGRTQTPSWSTIYNGDIYSRSINLGIICDSETLENGFVPAMLVNSKDTNVYAYTSEQISGDKNFVYKNSQGGTQDSGGFAQNLDFNNNSFNSQDIWLNNFVFPTKEQVDLMTNNENIQSIYIDGDYEYENNSNINFDRLTAVYVNGNLNVNSNITTQSADGFMLFIVNGNIYFNKNVGQSNYQTNFTVDSKENIKAGFISTKENGIIEVLGDSNDIPLIIDGFLISKGKVVFNRNLAENNSKYPAVYIKSNYKNINELKDLIDFVGVKIFDVQWEYPF